MNRPEVSLRREVREKVEPEDKSLYTNTTETSCLASSGAKSGTALHQILFQTERSALSPILGGITPQPSRFKPRVS